MPQGSVSRLISLLKQGDDHAAEQIWARYQPRLLHLARYKLLNSRRRASDEEDLVQGVFNSFFRGVDNLKFPELDDRNDMWRLLATITSRKAFDQLRHEYSQRQGGGTVRGSSGFFSAGDGNHFRSLCDNGSTPPDFAAQMAEESIHLLEMLPNQSLRQVAILRMEDYTIAEIAELLGLTTRTISRKLEAIRSIWSRRLMP